MNNSKNLPLTQLFCLLILLLFIFGWTTKVQANDEIINFTATKIIGFKEKPKVNITLKVDKTRDLHVAVQNKDGWKTVKRITNRIKKSGKYHFFIDIDDLTPGQYRIDSYLSPKGKSWNDRLTEAKHAEVKVIDAEKYIKQTKFNEQDKIKYVDWPKQIVGKQAATLKVQYDITTPRDLHIKLLDSNNWKEYGKLSFPLTKPGNFTLPLSNLIDDFPAGKYAWVLYLTPSGDTKIISKKYGKHFVLVQDTVVKK